MTGPLLALALAVAPAPPPAAATPTFGAEVKLVWIEVSLESSRKEGLPQLTAEDFEILDNGVRQTVERVIPPGAGAQPIEVALVLDVSGSVSGMIDQLRSAAQALAAGLHPTDKALVLTFGRRIALRHPLGPPSPALDAALQAIAAGPGGAGFDDAVFVAAKLREPNPARAAIVLFSDGAGHDGWLDDSTTEDALRRSDAVFYAVRPPSFGWGRFGSRPEAGRGEGIPEERFRSDRGPAARLRDSSAVDGSERLQHLADLTGGRVWTTASADKLKQNFEAVLQEIRGRYVLAFTPTGVSPDGWHAIQVNLTRHKLKLQARKGYTGRPAPH